MHYLVTHEVHLTRHGGYARPGMWDVWVTNSFTNTEVYRQGMWATSDANPLTHDSQAWCAVVDDYGTLVPVASPEY